jgi:catechol 2,3-dioxygenase
MPLAARSPLSTTGAQLADATRLGAVELTVANLDRSIAFYRDVIGLRLHGREDPVARMGAGGEDLVVLHEDPAARAPARTAGLYHYALLVPSREELARVTMRVAQARVPVQGASNHGTHEAIYLPDPDGIGIELAADFPREQWPDWREVYAGGPAPLDVDGLVATVAGEEIPRQADAGLRMGHVHLHVGDLESSKRFYRDGLGFEVVADLGTAVFAAAGGYHHHVAFNVWRGRGVPPAPEGAIGLRQWTLELDGDGELAAARARLEAVGAPLEARNGGLLARDPSGIAVLLHTVSKEG